MHALPMTTAPEAARAPWHDPRLVGFATRTPLAVAQACIDALVGMTDEEEVALADALGRVLARPVVAPADLPPVARARVDGFAIQAAATFGAGPYNPIDLPLAGRSATSVASGNPLPADADAVLPFALATTRGDTIEITEPVAAGDGVEVAGGGLRRGDEVLPTGRRLGPTDLALAAELDLSRLPVRRRPHVRLVIFGAKHAAAGRADPLEFLLMGLVARDGGAAELKATGTVQDELAHALAAPSSADLILVAGRSGCGADDVAAPALASVGNFDLHGVAIAPGGSAGLGTVSGVPVLLLPGEPVACMTAYELLGGRAVRRMAGLPPALPHRRRVARLTGKLTSEIGSTDLWLVRRDGEDVAPSSAPDRASLGALAAAVGFVLVPAISEGYAAGSEVEVHLLGADG
jgi:molybdopterin molybdotransferase